VTRFRKTAVAAVAVSALLLAPTAAYAHDGHHGVSASTKFSGMRWAQYSGELTDFTSTSPDVFKGAKATAYMMGLEGKSLFRLRVTGIDKTAAGGKYGVHLHQGKCDAGDFNLAGPHYNVTWNPTTKLMDLVSTKTEVWLDLKVNSSGSALSTATVPFIPEGERSIVLHAEPTMRQSSDPAKPVGWAGTRLACLPFTIKSLPSRS
jgi:Cu/Zn superoxide dismutase